MMKNLVFCLLIGMALTSYSGPMNENRHVIKVDIEHSRPMELSDFVESIKLLPLETLIKDIRRLVMLEAMKKG